MENPIIREIIHILSFIKEVDSQIEIIHILSYLKEVDSQIEFWPPWRRRRFKPRIRSPYPQSVVKGD